MPITRLIKKLGELIKGNIIMSKKQRNGIVKTIPVVFSQNIDKNQFAFAILNVHYNYVDGQTRKTIEATKRLKMVIPGDQDKILQKVCKYMTDFKSIDVNIIKVYEKIVY